MHDYEDERDELDETVTDKELSQLIDEWLAEARPERYQADDKEWMDAVVQKARDAIRQYQTFEEAIEDAARRRVHQREGQATKRTNRILRDIARNGRLPLGWGEGDDWQKMLFDILHLPLSIERWRVRFGAMSAGDLEQWELESGRESDKRAEAERQSREGARLVAQWVLAQGVQRVQDLRAGGEAGT